MFIFSVTAGLLAAFSPCSLPVYPLLLNRLARERQRKLAAVAFAAGLSLMYAVFYLLMGFALRILGDVVFRSLDTVYLILYALAAVVCSLFALQSLGLLTLYGRTFGFTSVQGSGVFGAFLTGVFFATVISPCNLPFMIAGVLPALLSSSTVLDGLLLIFGFSVSLSVPMLLVGLLSGHAMNEWLRRRVRLIECVSAGFLLLVSMYFAYMVMQYFL